MNIPLSAFVPENLGARDGPGSAVPSRVSLLFSILRLNLVLTYGIRPEFRGGAHSFILNRYTPSGQSRVYRVMHFRTDGVHCRESAGTGPVNLEVVPNECCLGSVTMDQLVCASLSHTHYLYEVDMLKVWSGLEVTVHFKLRPGRFLDLTCISG